MAIFISVGRTIRNNWKKSVFGCTVISYAIYKAKGKYECDALMAEYCREALKYGNMPYRVGSKLRNIVVFLNPSANKRKAKKDFDKFCAPLLYLAGICVNVVQTQAQGDARRLAEQFNESVDAVVVAGGDGTLSETVTGLLRRETGPDPLPRRISVGILPLGQINNAAKSIFGDSEKDKVKRMAEATMAIIQEIGKPVDVIRIDQLEEQGQRPVYGVSGLRWGAVHDTYAEQDKYWYWGAFRAYVAYIFMGRKEDGKGVTWNCNAKLQYSLPCSGCSQCYLSEERVKPKTPLRWWQHYVPKKPTTFNYAPKIDYSKVINDNCNKFHEVDISSVDLSLETLWEQENESDAPYIKVSVGPASLSYFDFIDRGWQYIKGTSIENSITLQVKDLRIQPNIISTQDTEHWFYIDNEDYEVKPIYIKLLPKRITMYCGRQTANSIEKPKSM